MLSQAGARLSTSQLAYGLRYVVASLWVYAENARPMAVEKLTLSGSIDNILLICLFYLIMFHYCESFPLLVQYTLY